MHISGPMCLFMHDYIYVYKIYPRRYSTLKISGQMRMVIYSYQIRIVRCRRLYTYKVNNSQQHAERLQNLHMR